MKQIVKNYEVTTDIPAQQQGAHGVPHRRKA
jgi:hypothetical protein